jgi:hypothetical protein
MMDSGTAEDQMVELLMAHERALSGLYEAFSSKFPEDQAFWLALSKEAALHARMVGRLHVRIQAGEGIVREDRFDRQSLETSLVKILELMDVLDSSEYALFDALKTADHIEQSVLGHKYFDIFEGHTLEIKQIQYFLSDALKDHHERLAKRLADMP